MINIPKKVKKILLEGNKKYFLQGFEKFFDHRYVQIDCLSEIWFMSEFRDPEEKIIKHLSENKFKDKKGFDNFQKLVKKCYPCLEILLLAINTDMNTIEQHNINVFKEYLVHKEFREIDNKFFPKVDGVRAFENFIPVIILLHDIGKSLEGREKQHVNTIPILEKALKLWGFNNKEIKLAKNLVEADIIGDCVLDRVKLPDSFVKKGNVDKLVKNETQKDKRRWLHVSVALDLLNYKSWKLEMKMVDYFIIQGILYNSDAGAYKDVKKRYMRTYDPYKFFAYCPDKTYLNCYDLLCEKIIIANKDFESFAL